MQVKVKVKPITDVVQALGLQPTGKTQLYATHEIRRRMTRYMPYRTGTLATKLTAVTSSTTITVRAPYAEWLYNGITRGGAPINYTRTHNPLAGPEWDITMMNHEKESLAEAVKLYAGRAKR